MGVRFETLGASLVGVLGANTLFALPLRNLENGFRFVEWNRDISIDRCEIKKQHGATIEGAPLGKEA